MVFVVVVVVVVAEDVRAQSCARASEHAECVRRAGSTVRDRRDGLVATHHSNPMATQPNIVMYTSRGPGNLPSVALTDGGVSDDARQNAHCSMK